jgi:hypothetical protein
VLAGPVHAQTSVLNLISNDTEPYARFSRQLSNDLGHGRQAVSVSTLTANEFAAARESASRFDVCVAAGLQAVELLSNREVQCRQLHTLVPALLYRKKLANHEIRCPAGRCQALVIDQPWARQMALIKRALPATRRVAVVVSDFSRDELPALRAAARAEGMALHSTRLKDPDDIVDTVSHAIQDSQVLLALPDPLVLNRFTARAVLLTTYRAQIPVVAYSAAYVKAGAVLGLYTTPEQFARQTAEMVFSRSSRNGNAHIVYPEYFTVNKNPSVEESLNLDIPPLRALEKRLRGKERE